MVRRHARFRCRATLAGALAVVASLSACSSGDDRPAATSSSAAPQRGMTLPQARTVVAQYDRDNTKAIRAALNPPYRASAWEAVDSGPTLEFDRVGTLQARAEKKRTKPVSRHQATAVVGYARQIKGNLALVRVDEPRTGTATGAGASAGSSLMVLRQEPGRQRWRQWSSTGLRRDVGSDLPSQAGRDGTPTPAQLKRATPLVDQVVAATQDGKAAGISGAGRIRQSIESRWVDRQNARSLTTACTTYTPRGSSDVAETMQSVQTDRGVLSLITLRCQSDAVSAEGTYWDIPSWLRKATGVTERYPQVQAVTTMVSVLVLQPEGGGRARFLGSGDVDVLPAD